MQRATQFCSLISVSSSLSLFWNSMKSINNQFMLKKKKKQHTEYSSENFLEIDSVWLRYV